MRSVGPATDLCAYTIIQDTLAKHKQVNYMPLTIRYWQQTADLRSVRKSSWKKRYVCQCQYNIASNYCVCSTAYTARHQSLNTDRIYDRHLGNARRQRINTTTAQ